MSRRAQAELRSKANAAATRFFLNHKKEISGCDANIVLMEGAIDAALLDITDIQSWEIVYPSVRSQLAGNAPTESEIAERNAERARKEAEKAAQSAREAKAREAEQAERNNPRFNSEYWTTDRLKAYLKERYIIRGSREERQLAATGGTGVLPSEYPREAIIKFSFSQLCELGEKYGVQAVIDRLDGKN